MDFTDEEIGQMLGERLHERSDLASHARAELAKVQPVSARNYNGEKAALFLARIGVLIQHVRSQLKHPSEDGGWITGDRLRSIFMAACAVKNPDAESYVTEESYVSGLSIAGTNTWLESQRCARPNSDQKPCRIEPVWIPVGRPQSLWTKLKRM